MYVPGPAIEFIYIFSLYRISYYMDFEDPILKICSATVAEPCVREKSLVDIRVNLIQNVYSTLHKVLITKIAMGMSRKHFSVFVVYQISSNQINPSNIFR